ncbi:MAG TPA: VTT domain-containing protein [Pyrinomonadaceae bacterium]|jgi:uncharacterized membrane protein YdjX (TVP38/TMEM64 family)
MKDQSRFKQILTISWILFLITCIGIFFIYSEHFTPQKIAAFIEEFKGGVLIIYLFISLLRGLTLVPSTPFVLAGTILLPNNPFLVLLISITGIIFSSTMIYYFSDYLGFGTYLEKKYPGKIIKIKEQLQKPTGFFFVFFWSFFPVLPTDAVCYVAGVLRIDFKKYILAITLGELIICSIYIFFYGILSDVFKQYFG